MKSVMISTTNNITTTKNDNENAAESTHPFQLLRECNERTNVAGKEFPTPPILQNSYPLYIYGAVVDDVIVYILRNNPRPSNW